MNLFIKIFCRFIYTFYFCAIKRTFFETLFTYISLVYSLLSAEPLVLCTKMGYHL